jgi:hypothetical protein
VKLELLTRVKPNALGLSLVVGGQKPVGRECDEALVGLPLVAGAVDLTARLEVHAVRKRGLNN